MVYQIIQHVHNDYNSVQLRFHDNEQPSGVEQNSRVSPRHLQATLVHCQHCLQPVPPPQIRLHWYLHLRGHGQSPVQGFLPRTLYIPSRSMELAGLHGDQHGVSSLRHVDHLRGVSTFSFLGQDCDSSPQICH